MLIGQVKQYFAYESQHQHGAFDKTGGFKYFFIFIPIWEGSRSPIGKLVCPRGNTPRLVTCVVASSYTGGYPRARSPTWHRSARAKRSKARARIKRAQKTGRLRSGVYADLVLLESHHSAPRYLKLRRLIAQGMSRWQNPREWKNDWQNNSAYYARSYGAAPKGKGKAKNGDKKDKNGAKDKEIPKEAPKTSSTSASSSGAVGPAYMDMLKENQKPESKKQQAVEMIGTVLSKAMDESDFEAVMNKLRTAMPEVPAVPQGEASLKTRIHRLGNALGKATGKVAKLKDDISVKTRTWTQCQTAIREWANSQKHAFEKDIQETREMLTKAQQEEQDAMDQLRDLQKLLDEKPEVATTATPMQLESYDMTLFDTPPTEVKEGSCGLTPDIAKVSLQLLKVEEEKKRLEAEHMMMLEHSKQSSIAQEQLRQQLQDQELAAGLALQQVEAKQSKLTEENQSIVGRNQALLLKLQQANGMQEVKGTTHGRAFRDAMLERGRQAARTEGLPEEVDRGSESARERSRTPSKNGSQELESMG